MAAGALGWAETPLDTYIRKTQEPETSLSALRNLYGRTDK